MREDSEASSKDSWMVWLPLNARIVSVASIWKRQLANGAGAPAVTRCGAASTGSNVPTLDIQVAAKLMF
jgi:hypothetical protein